MGDAVSTLINKLSDPSTRWFIWEHFSRRVYGSVTATNQTLAICDDIICLPVRFSEYFKWWDPSTNAPGNRMFDRSEAWDHNNETNPTTLYPYDGNSMGILGYGGYFIPINLTDGSNRVVIHIVRKFNQLLIMNMGYYIRDGTRYTISLPVKVLFPPSGLNLAYTTNGTVGSDGITISSGQYVIFRPGTESPYGIDTTNGIFTISPMGTSKLLDHELQVPSFRWGNVDIPSMYIGVRTRSNAQNLMHMINYILIQSRIRAPINVSGTINSAIISDVYDSDPYCNATTWAEHNIPFAYYTGWATDENDNVILLYASSLAHKHTTKLEMRAEISQTRIHDFSTNETYVIAYRRPLTNIYCYGRGGAVTTPMAVHHLDNAYMEVLGWSDANMMVLVKPDDSVETKTSPATGIWEWNDGYGACNVWSDRALCFEYLAFYTDDTAISINPKDQGINRNGTFKWKVGFVTTQIKSFMDRTWYQNRVYVAISRIWFDQGGQPASYYAERIRRYTPRVLTSQEWSNLVSLFLPPYTLNLVGGAPHPNARYVEFTVNPTNPQPGQQFTVSGTVRASPVTGSPPMANARVIVMIVDPDTGTAVLSTSTQTDSSGRFSLTLNAPQEPKNYRILIIARP